MYSLIEDTKYLGLYYVRYPDGVLSEISYNRARATEFMYRLNKGEINPRIGFKKVS